MVNVVENSRICVFTRLVTFNINYYTIGEIRSYTTHDLMLLRDLEICSSNLMHMLWCCKHTPQDYFLPHLPWQVSSFRHKIWKSLNGSFFNMSLTISLTYLLWLITYEPEFVTTNHYYYLLLMTIHTVLQREST